ncbi:NUDIX hydrolase, partial [bacterium]|nr:NUDIX hydrolase [bacterium]
HFKNKAIAILPLDEEGNTWLVGQYRYALDSYSWEVPMGGGPLEVDILASAKRELKEETGLTASQWTELQLIHTSNSVTDEVGHIFLAQGTTDYSAYTPTYGIEVDKSFTEGEGIRRYSVTWIQSNSGGDPLTNPVLQFTSKVPFTYPGRAKAYYIPFTVGAYTSHRAYDVFLSPPVQCLIDATTIVYYRSTNTAPTPSVGYTLWNPTDWAVMQSKWIGWSDSPRSKVEGLRGYIAMNPTVNATALVVGATYTILSVGTTTWTSVGASSNTAGTIFVATGVGTGDGTAIRNSVNGTSTSATDRSVFGDRVFASTSFEIILSGGPTDPSGTNKTLSIEQVPAFTKTDGTQYYRVTEVYATIPTQPALPTLAT